MEKKINLLKPSTLGGIIQYSPDQCSFQPIPSFLFVVILVDIVMQLCEISMHYRYFLQQIQASLKFCRFYSSRFRGTKRNRIFLENGWTNFHVWSSYVALNEAQNLSKRQNFDTFRYLSSSFHSLVGLPLATKFCIFFNVFGLAII